MKLRALLVLLAAIAVAGCGEPEPLRIGFLGGVSGRVADLGIGGRNGAQMAIEAVNRQGGVNGRQVILVVKDDGQDPEKAAKAMREFGQTGIRLVIGPMTSAMALAALPVAEEFGILLVSPTVTTHELSGKDDLFVRVVSPATEYARRSAEYHLKTNGPKRLAAIRDTHNDSYTTSWLSAFRGHFEKRGHRIVREVGFESGLAAGLRERVRATLGDDVDGLLVLANSVDAALIVQYARAERPGLPIIMSEWPAGERFVELAGAAGEGVVAAQFFDRDSNEPAFVQFRDEFRQRFGVNPGYAGVTGYDAAALALQGLVASVADPRRHVVGIKQFNGLQGPIRIDRNGDAMRRTYITRVENGKFRVVE